MFNDYFEDDNVLENVFDDMYGEHREMELYTRNGTSYESYVCGYARTKDIKNAIAEYESTNIWD